MQWSDSAEWSLKFTQKEKETKCECEMNHFLCSIVFKIEKLRDKWDNGDDDDYRFKSL